MLIIHNYVLQDLKSNCTKITLFFNMQYFVVRYPNARSLNRRIIFHAGPTNSGKTYHALERYLSAKSGIYCGPLKLLATEVFKKANERVMVWLSFLLPPKLRYNQNLILYIYVKLNHKYYI